MNMPTLARYKPAISRGGLRSCVAWLYPGGMILLYIFVVTHTPISILAIAAHDDGLFMSLGRHLAEGRWLGSFSQFTLMKGPGYPAFLAANNWLGTPVSFAHAVFHCAAVTFFVFVAHRFIRSLFLSGLLFTLLLWQPVSLTSDLLHVRRERLYFDQLLVFLAAFAWALFGARYVGQRLLFAALGGASFGWFWLTREEGVAVTPGLAILLGAAAIQSYREKRLASLGALLVVAIGVFASTQVAFRAGNWMAYGSFVGVDFKETNFQRALQALHSVRSGGTKRYVAMTHATRQHVNAVSPTFASTDSYFKGPGRGWEQFGCAIHSSTCGEIGAGHFVWALRDVAERRGHFSSPAAASTFFGRLADEVKAACSKGLLECVSQPFAEMPPVTWHQLAQGLGENFQRMVKLLLIPRLGEEPASSDGNEVELEAFLRFLNYPRHTKSQDVAGLFTVWISGWYYRSGADWLSLSVVSADGSAANAQLKRKKSPDIATHFADNLAAFQRYTINVECNDQCVLRAEAPDGSRVERRFVDLASAPLGIRVGAGTLYVDRAVSAGEEQYRVIRADAVAAHLRLLTLRSYKYLFIPVLLLGALAFVAATLFSWRTAVGNVCYVMALTAWVIAFTHAVLLLLIAATSFPALNVHYMAPAYFMLVSGAVLSGAAWLQLRDRRVVGSSPRL